MDRGSQAVSHIRRANPDGARAGLNPHKFGKLANEKQEPWKKPLPEFIEEIYFKRFGKRRPDVVRSIEQLVQDQREKKAEQNARKDNPDQEQAVNNNTEKAPN